MGNYKFVRRNRSTSRGGGAACLSASEEPQNKHKTNTHFFAQDDGEESAAPSINHGSPRNSPVVGCRPCSKRLDNYKVGGGSHRNLEVFDEM